MPTTVELPRSIATAVTTAGALAIGKHNPVNTTSGALSMTLPTAAAGNAGRRLSVEKVDSSTNLVSITGSIRGTNGATITLSWQYESIDFVADAAGSWWPVAGHKTKASLDAAYGPLYNTVPRDAGTGQWHLDVLQGSNNGTKLPFTSRTVDVNGTPVAEQINAKPTTDLYEGVIDWQHNSAQGDLLHLTAGAGMTNTSNSAALIALGLDKGYPTGILVNNKGTATRGIGIKIQQNSTINVATDAYGFQVDQYSPTSPAVYLHQTDGAAPLMILYADTAITANSTALLQVTAAGATLGQIRAKTGEIYWQADIIEHDGGGFLNLASGTATDTNQTKQLSDGFHVRAFSGSAGIYYPGRISRASGGLKMDVAPNTSGGPNYGIATWQTGIAVKPGSAAASTMLGLSAPATTATEGFPYIPAIAGAPTGVPTAQTGYSPVAFDTTNNKLWVYNGGWKGVVLA